MLCWAMCLLLSNNSELICGQIRQNYNQESVISVMLYSFTVLYQLITRIFQRVSLPHFHNVSSSDHPRKKSASRYTYIILIVSLTHYLHSFSVLVFCIEKHVWFWFAYRCFSSEFVPYGNETGWLAVYSSRGPSVHDATVAAMIDRVQIGKPLLLEVSGYCQPCHSNPCAI